LKYPGRLAIMEWFSIVKNQTDASVVEGEGMR